MPPWEKYQSNYSPDTAPASDGPWNKYKPAESSDSESGSPKFYELEKQQGLPKGPMELIKQAGSQVLGAFTSPMPGSILGLPAKVVTEAANQTGAEVAKGLSTPGGALPDIGKPAARLAGFGASIALNPVSYTPLGVATKVTPKQSAVESLTTQASKKLKDIASEYGGKLNKAKESVGLPTSAEARAASIEKNGNAFGFGKDDIKEISLRLAEGDTNAAAKIEDRLLGGKGTEEITYHAPQKAGLRFLSPPSKAIKAEGMGGDELAGLKGQKVLDKNVIDDLKSILQSEKASKPEDLVVAINKFERLATGMPEQAKVKLASLLQDKINAFVNWEKTGNITEGVLKKQYKALSELALPSSLIADKASMKAVLDTTKELKALEGTPGKAEAWLRTAITGKSAVNKDKLTALAHLEQLSGEKIIEPLRKAIQKEGPGLLTEMAKGTPVFGPLLERVMKIIQTAASSPKVTEMIKQAGVQSTKGIMPVSGFILRDAYPDAASALKKVKNKLEGK